MGAFVLLTKKQKKDFCNKLVSSVEIALLNSGKKMSVSTKCDFTYKMFKLVGLTKNDLSVLNVSKHSKELKK